MGEKRWEVAPIQLQATYNQASLSPDTNWDRSNMPLLLSALPGPVWGLVRLASAFFSRSPPSVGGLFTSSPPSTHVLSKPPPEKLTWNPHHLYLWCIHTSSKLRVELAATKDAEVRKHSREAKFQLDRGTGSGDLVCDTLAIVSNALHAYLEIAKRLVFCVLPQRTEKHGRWCMC